MDYFTLAGNNKCRFRTFKKELLMNPSDELKRKLCNEAKQLVLKGLAEWLKNPEFLVEFQRINQEIADKCGEVITSFPVAILTRTIAAEELPKRVEAEESNVASAWRQPNVNIDIVEDDIDLLKAMKIKVSNGEAEELQEDLHKALAGILNGKRENSAEQFSGGAQDKEEAALDRYKKMAVDDQRTNEQILASIMQFAINTAPGARYFLASFINNHEAMKNMGLKLPATKDMIENDKNWPAAVKDVINKMFQEAEIYGMGKTVLLLFEVLFKKAASNFLQD